MVKSVGNALFDLGCWAVDKVANLGVHYLYPFVKSYYFMGFSAFCAVTWTVDALARKYLPTHTNVCAVTGWGWAAGKFIPITVPSKAWEVASKLFSFLRKDAPAVLLSGDAVAASSAGNAVTGSDVAASKYHTCEEFAKLNNKTGLERIGKMTQEEKTEWLESFNHLTHGYKMPKAVRNALGMTEADEKASKKLATRHRSDSFDASAVKA